MFILLKIAARNVLRNKRRSAITFVAIGMGLMMIIVFQGVIGGMDKQITDNFIKAQAGHIQIHAQGYAEKARLLPLEYTLSEPEKLAEAVRRIPGVREVAQRIRFAALISSGTESLPVMGLAIQPEEERKVSVVADSMISGSYLDSRPGYVLIGKELAEDLKLQVGQVLILVANTASGAMNAIDPEIKGIFYTGYAQLDSSVIILSLADAQKLLKLTGMVTELVVNLDDIDRTDEVVSLLQKELTTLLSPSPKVEIETWKETGAAIWQVLELRRLILSIISVIVVVIATLGIANTMLMSVFERTREIGTMMAFGMTRKEILALFIFESMLLGAAGGILGAFVGGSLVKYLSIVGISPPGAVSSIIAAPLGKVLYAHFSWLWILVFFLLAQFIAVLAALYPAYLASKQEPVEALRHV